MDLFVRVFFVRSSIEDSVSLRLTHYFYRCLVPKSIHNDTDSNVLGRLMKHYVLTGFPRALDTPLAKKPKVVMPDVFRSHRTGDDM